MTLPILLLLGTVLVGLILFALEIVPTDVTALGILFFLTVAGLLPIDRAFAGFGSDAVIMILGILVMVEALIRTGVTDWAGRVILRQTDTSASKILLRGHDCLGGDGGLYQQHRGDRVFSPHRDRPGAPGQAQPGQVPDAAGLCLDPRQLDHPDQHLYQRHRQQRDPKVRHGAAGDV